MKLNFYSGRSYNNLSHYPAMPWVLHMYTQKDVLKEENIDAENYVNYKNRDFWAKHKEQFFNKMKLRNTSTTSIEEEIQNIKSFMLDPDILLKEHNNFEPLFQIQK